MEDNEYVNKVVLADGETLIDLTTDDVTRAQVADGAHFHLPSGEQTTGTCTFDADTRDADANASDILYGKTAYKNGSKITGTCTFDADTKDADASAADILYGKTAYKNGSKITGTCTFDADTSDADADAADLLYGKTAYKQGSKITGTMPNREGAAFTITERDQEYQIQNGYHDGNGSVSISRPDRAKMIPENIRHDVTILGIQGTMSGSEDVHAVYLNVTPYLTPASYLPQSPYNYFNEVNVFAIEIVETDNLAGGKTVTIGTAAPDPEPEPED